MTRIGFAYNQKPDASIETTGQLDGRVESSIVGSDEEPPSFHVAGSRGTAQGDLAVAPRAAAAPSSRAGDDSYAEWDSPETIAAVHRALSALGEVIPLEATADFPQRLREARPDIVFNIAEGFAGQNRESHVPAICEFYGIPYSGSDPLTLSLCLNKARTKQVL